MYFPKKTSPEVKEIKFGDLTKKCFLVKIPNKDYSACVEAASNRWSNKKKGTYGKGLANTSEDPFRVERTGLLGEIAIAKLLGLGVDNEYKEKGDVQDFLWGDTKIDIKTAIKLPEYQAGLIYARNQWGKDIPLTKDIYIFNYLEKDDRVLQEAEVIVIGYAINDFIKNLPLVRARAWNSTHLNREVPYQDLQSIEDIENVYKKCLKKE
jgi:hypothetical protein